ncbi:winged helix DNA-binding protein [Mumia flava]|uniref:Winged helix DNA-binding protein n=1 Tax=Mumia flava TaxID=1348852 RepID=A0A0B2BKC9_9ACTN|nr:winged helix DNA-binding domain-containing protein [Mumia flava]PJJ53643.1 winged helix DNA-binding protein [Mumia flava]
MRILDAQRRARLVAQHALGAERPDSVEAVVRRVLALHATDPATVYLSVLARRAGAGIDDVRAAMYERRSLVRVLAMRRTLFVVERDDVPMVHAGASLGVARTLRTRLVRQLADLPTDPEVPDPEAWLIDVARGVEASLAERGTASGAQLAQDVPALRTAFLPTTDKRWDVRRNATSPALAWLSAEGVIVRSEPRGDWRSRHHVWAPVTDWFPEGIEELSEPDARARLAHRWLAVFGPATLDDLQWWAGWSKTQTRAAVAALPDVREVELACGPGLVLDSTDLGIGDPDPARVTLLPALDPTPMGWKERGWFLGPHADRLFDRFGNVGPTVWSGGRVVGGWAVRPDGEVVTALLEDVGGDVSDATDTEAQRIAALLDGAPVVPSFPTPLEKELRTA